MSLSEKGNGDDSESMETMNIENANLDNSLSSLSSNDIQNLSELSQELTLTTDMETEEQEIVVENQEIVGHEEEVEMEEVVTEDAVSEDAVSEDADVILETSNKSDDQIFDTRANKTTVVPPLRPLTIAPKPTKMPLTVKSVGGQPLLLLQGTGANQAIKLVAPQGQEINLANLISRPVTLKPTFKSISSPGGNISLVQQKPVIMKKVLTTSQKTVTKPLTSVTKPTQHFMVVQKADQQQINVLGMQTPTKTLTLQQAQEMGLLTNAKISHPGQSTGKQTVLLAKNPQKSIKLIPQVSSHQIITTGVGTKTVTLNQLKVPAKILPAGTNTTNKTTQRIIFKTATGNQTILPQAQLLQVSAAQVLNTGQLHQINIPGRGMQYIKFVTTSTSDANTTTTTGTTIKTTPIVTPTNIVLSEVKPVSSLNRIIPKIHPKDKLPISPLSKPLTTTPLMVIPAHIPVTQQVPVSKVTIPPAAPPPKNAPTLKAPIGSENTSPVPVKEEVDANGMRPRKPCNCNKSQCLKLYCDCFANGEFCYMCNCMNCFNNLENEEHRNRAIKACLERNPNAFRPKIGKAKDVAGDISIRKHTKGCNCKRSGCLKNYCECYEAKIACSNNCKCIGCRNIEDSVEKKNVRLVNEKSTNTPVYTETLIVNNKNICQIRPRRSSSSRKQTINFITDDVIEATCQCLLTISDNADENVQDEEMTKHLIIEEFGRCLTEIIDCSSNRSLS